MVQWCSQGRFSMNVLIDLRWMFLGRAGGLEQMAYELVAALPRVSGGDRFYLYCPERVFGDWLFASDLKMNHIDSDRFALVPERVDYDRSEGWSGTTLAKLGIVPLDGSKSGSRVFDLDLVHSIGGYVHDELLDYRNVLTVHDLQHIHFPQYFDEVEIAARNARYSTSIQASKAVVCISDFVKRDVLDQYRVDRENVFTIWNIPSGSPTRQFPESKVKRILRRMGIKFEFLFFPSHGWPHKNHETLVEAFGLIRKSLPDLKLVFTGGKFGRDHPAAQKIQALGLGDSVFHIGYRTPAEVQCLYQGAKALVYPSLFEGFGMPVAEAIEAGTPVVCSDIEPLAEIGGNAIVTFNPRDSHHIAEKVLWLLENDSVREDLREKGNAQQKLFSASEIALKTYNVYRLCCGLDPIGSQLVQRELKSRCESARHWGRVCERRFKKGHVVLGSMAFLATAWFSPRLAKSVWMSLSKKRREDRREFVGRYGDGWISDKYREWFLVPKGSTRLVLGFEAPPLPHAEELEFRVALEEIQMGSFRFEDDISLDVPINLPRNSGDLVRLEIDVNRTFRPSEYDSNGDDRDLAIKLAGIRWK